MEGRSYLKSKKLFKNTTFLTVCFVSLALISSSSLSANINNISEIKDSQLRGIEEITPIVVETSAGLAPNIANENLNIQTTSGPLSDIMWGYIANSSTYNEGTCYFYLDDPGTIEYLKDTESDDFLSGGTGGSDEIWYGVQYSDGVLWGMDIYSEDMWCIGGGGDGLNGLAWDPIYNRLYGASGSKLYEVEPETGEQEFIGSFGSGVNEMIAIASNNDGTMYGWDLGDKLWTIDVETGEATEVGPLGIDLNYAQDGGFDYETGDLWLTAYTVSPNYGCYLYVCDEVTAECTLIDQFEGNSQITASFVSFGCPCPEHDVGVKSINYPESGIAIENIPMQVTIKNYGNNTETTDVQMEVGKYDDEGSIILEEDFSGTFPPEGWETDSWTQCSDNCSPDPPCACLYKYDMYENYSAYITSKPVDASEYEKCNLRFYFAADWYYPQYCYFYVWYRKDESSPWKDVTPWDHPLYQQMEGDIFEIGIYSFGSPDGCGEALQIKWGYVGYYYYMNYCVLDSIILEGYNESIEYAELVQDITIGIGEVVVVDFPTWTPSCWQDPDYENTWQDFPVKAFTILDGDHNPSNDCKDKNVDLYFPWFHDMEITSIDSPCEDGPGKTYPVEATIKNVGQYADCCVPITIKINELAVQETMLTEEDWDTIPPDGWHDEHKDYSEDYGWEKSYTSYSGGDSPEARLRYYKAKSDYVFYSYAIDTSDYTNCRLEFKSFIDHSSGSGLYALEAGYSTDAETWTTLWHERPNESGNYDVMCYFEGGHETLYIGFWVIGNPYYFDYWFIDNIYVNAIELIQEYSDKACQGDDLEPGETRTFEFDDWTPDFLQYETSGSVNYIINAEINMQGDQNPDNDAKSGYFSLEYWHDVGIDEVTSPGDGGTREYDVLWNNGEPDGRDAIAGSMYQGYSNIIIDDFKNENYWSVKGGHFRFVWNSGTGTGNLETVRVYFFENQGGCDPSLDAWAEREVTEFDEEYTGNYYFGCPEIAVDVEFDDVYLTCLGKWYVGFQPEGINDDIAYMLTAEGYGCEVMADLPYWEYPRWTSSQDIWGEEYDLSWKLTGYGSGCCCPVVFIQPGTESIDAIAINYGTFPEMDLTCYAEVWEYITDPENGKLVYEDNITNIDLDEPLGGEEILEFEDYTFAYEGKYLLEIDLPAPNDDEPINNLYKLEVKVDDTRPNSWHTLDPPEPDGENGWYVNDVEVTLQATDPLSNGVSSGVKEIKYQIGGGPVQTIPGSYGIFYLTKEHEGYDVEVEYWAIDNVGHEETHNRFIINMDQTAPDIYLSYVVDGGNPTDGWTLVFTAYAYDMLSLMDRVEFYLNDVWQETIYGPGPEYKWSFIYHGGLNIIITAKAYDKAGNMASDYVENPKSFSYNQNSQQQSQSHTSSYIINKPQQRLFTIPGVGYR